MVNTPYKNGHSSLIKCQTKRQIRHQSKTVYLAQIMLLFYWLLWAPSMQAEVLYQLKWPDKELWVLGTIHLSSQPGSALSDSTQQLISNSNQLWVELNEEALNAGSVLLLESGLRAEPYLKDQLTPATWDALAALSARLGLAPSMLERMEPWLIEILMQTRWLQINNLHHTGVDEQVLNYAKKIELAANALETVEQQITLFEQLQAGTEVEAFIEQLLIDLPQIEAEFIALEALWQAGDLAAIWRQVTAELDAKSLEILLYQRNKAWVQTIMANLAENDQHFVAVGAAHLAGEFGLLALFEAQGAVLIKRGTQSKGEPNQ